MENQPYTSSTIWRTISDSSNRVVLFDSAMAPATFWVKLEDLDLKPGAPVKKLELAGGKTYNASGQIAGNAAANGLLKREYRQPWKHPHRG